MEILLVSSLSYLSGSIPFGLILTKIFSNKDVRKIGSGNIGATNVLRTGNKFLASLTLLLDMAKGYLPVILTLQYFPELFQISCLLAFLGHVFPIWLKFNGGKGVATYLGILFALSYGLGFLFIFTWIMVTLIFKYSSVSSMFASMTIFVVSLFREIALSIFYVTLEMQSEINSNNSKGMTFILFIFFILILFTHRKNISNLKNKNEHKIKL